MTAAQLTPWVVFLVGVAALLVLDIGVIGRRRSAPTQQLNSVQLGIAQAKADWMAGGGHFVVNGTSHLGGASGVSREDGERNTAVLEFGI